MTIPLIGVTIYRSTNKNGLPIHAVNESYIQALIEAGGAPVLIPANLPDAVLQTVINHLDGVLLTGGGDIEPGLFGEQSHPRVYDIDPDRDRIEIQLVRAFINRQRPFLGICRGIQVINVALGGTLYTDIADQYPGALRHDYYPNIPRDHLAHSVQVNQTSRLAHILGRTSVEVNSLHHQAIRQPADALTTTAYAPDGIIEAVELPGHPFGIGVQWHPENLQVYEPMRALFQALVQAAQSQD